MSENIIEKIMRKVDVDSSEFYRMIFPKVQEVVLELLRPSKEQILLWKNTPNGKKQFQRHISSMFHETPSSDTVQILWNYYTCNKIIIRNHHLIDAFKENNYRICAHCGITKGKFHVDHIIPLAKGGRDELSNLQFLCEKCNIKKSSQFDCKISIF